MARATRPINAQAESCRGVFFFFFTHNNKVRGEILFGYDEDGVDTVANRHLIIALDLLSQAQQNAAIAEVLQARALAGK